MTAEFGNFAGATPTFEFKDPSCHPEAVAFVDAGSFPGKAGRFTADGNTLCYGDNANLRVHMTGFVSGGPSVWAVPNKQDA